MQICSEGYLSLYRILKMFAWHWRSLFPETSHGWLDLPLPSLRGRSRSSNLRLSRCTRSVILRHLVVSSSLFTGCRHLTDRRSLVSAPNAYTDTLSS